MNWSTEMLRLGDDFRVPDSPEAQYDQLAGCQSFRMNHLCSVEMQAKHKKENSPYG